VQWSEKVLSHHPKSADETMPGRIGFCTKGYAAENDGFHLFRLNASTGKPATCSYKNWLFGFVRGITSGET
jgi:hypothetical protein